MTTTTENLTLENFTKETGFRFRVSKLQAARIALTAMDPADRQALAVLDKEQAADKLDARNPKGTPLNWVKEAVELADGWDGSLNLTREVAFQDFLENDGLAGLQKKTRQQQEIPDSIYREPGLTLANFTDRVEAAISVRRRFRVSREQHAKITAGEMTREQALEETIKEKQQ